MRHSRFICATAFAAALFAAGVATANKAFSAPLVGFDADSAVKERNLEAKFDTYFDPAEQREWLKLMASRPNQVGSPHDKENADWMLGKLKSWGWDAHIETFYVLYPTPKTVAVELLGPRPYKLHLIEPPIPGDASSEQTRDVLPPYLAYQGDGDVTAEVVYANFGMPEDYKTLARMGVDVRGKIVIARYGGGWRGLKPKLAQEHGAVGCLIYSDPAEDGYGADDVYPKGGARPPYGVQRGSVQDMTLYPGDPTTPGVGSAKDAQHLSRADARTILKIPALPISYAEAQPILDALGGPVAPKSFRGGLPITYHVGPSSGGAKVHLSVDSDWGLKPIYDVVAVMKGSVAPDQWVLRGNHHDGWVFGAWDPLAGNVALLQEAKALGLLAKSGWKPKRTIVYASWDAEEPGLIGSTEFAETHAAELQRKAVIYINSDTNGRGFLDVEGSHDLERMVNQIAADVRDPEQPVSILQRQRAAIGVHALTDPSPRDEVLAKKAAAGGDLPIGPLGSGSDYSSFVQHLGIPSINLGFGGEDQQGGIYHSAYDTFEHYARFGDPKFEYGVALGETAGRMVLRSADADVLPFAFEPFADTVGTYVDELKKLVTTSREKTETTNKLVRAEAFSTAADPTKTLIAPAIEEPAPRIDFTALDQAVGQLKASARAYDAALAKGVPAARRAQANAILQTVDQTLLDPEGLPGRPWFKNLAYAPGVLTGYGAKTLPGVREALEGHRWAEAQTYIARTAKALNAYAARVDQAAAALKAG